MIDDVSVDQAMLGAEVDITMNEPILSSQELAEECTQCPRLRERGHDELDDEHVLMSQDLAKECVKYPSLRPRGHDELDDHEQARDEDAHEDAKHAADEETGVSEPAEFDLALTHGVLWDMEGQGD